MTRKVTITFDAADPPTIAQFWATALGYEMPGPPPPFESWDAFADANNIPVENRRDIAAVEDPDGHGPRLLFLKVPEDKAGKNRVHLDIHSGAEYGTEREEHLAMVKTIVGELVTAGATAHESIEEHGARWTVMTDPEGNEFCVV